MNSAAYALIKACEALAQLKAEELEQPPALWTARIVERGKGYGYRATSEYLPPEYGPIEAKTWPALQRKCDRATRRAIKAGLLTETADCGLPPTQEPPPPNFL
jgi:hypothetical protein